VDQNLDEEPDRWVEASCFLCSNGCGIDIGVKDDRPGGRIVGVRGREADLVNRGRLGPKGLYAWMANASPDRLTHPLLRRGNRLDRVGWDKAMDLIVRRVKDATENYTAGSIGFYTSGQLFAEENYTLSVIAKAGIGTLHVDGNTRLCTATAGAALKESFGADGQPGAYEDIDVTDCFLLVGHDMAATATVLWARVLDRRRAAAPSRMIAIDPRRTATTAEADLHIRPRLGTNVAVLNGLLRQLIEQGHTDRAFIAAHTLGFDDLARTVAGYTPEQVAEIARIPADQLRQAADMIGRSKMLLSSCLQGVYQSNQGTAAAVQVNNVNLVLGRIGRPGCGILQMNGQPTAQNDREAGTGGDLPGFRNFDNPRHIDEIARLWNVDPDTLPSWAPPTHALQIFRYVETGSIRVLWIIGTNPAVSVPSLSRLRAILRKRGVFVIVQDAFMTETAEMADLVLPAAIWGEKTGCSTNVSRVVHLNPKAIEPPGEAKSDLDIFLDFARRMDFRDKDDAPLIKWADSEGVQCVARMLAGTALRLFGPLLREAELGLGHSLAGQRQAPRRVRPVLRRPRVRDRSRLLRELWPRPVDRGGGRAGRLPCEGAERPRLPAGRRIRPADRGARRGISVLPDDGACRLSLPHPHQDRAVQGAAGCGAGRLHPGERERRATARHRGRRDAAPHLPPRRRRGAGPGRRYRAGHAVHAVPLRLLGRSRPAARGQRADPLRVRPGQQAAASKIRRGQAGEGDGRAAAAAGRERAQGCHH
jgi:anaerobic selenocysteine-containing dehydrogenase